MASLLTRLKSLVPGQGEISPDDPRHPRHAPAEGEPHSAELFTTRRYPLYYLSITKCGCTYLQNLVYYLDHDRLHHDPDHIHDYRGDLVRAGAVADDDIRASKHGFTVVRDPVERFLSLYFDKIWNDKAEDFASVREMLVRDEGIVTGAAASLDDHRENCARFIDWVDRNLNKKTDIPTNRHWLRQNWRLRYARMFRLHALTLDGLDWQLPRFLGDLVADIDAQMKAVKVRNTAFRPYTTDEVLTDETRARINLLYANDRATYDSTAAAWAAIEAGEEGAEIPRLEPKKK